VNISYYQKRLYCCLAKAITDEDKNDKVAVVLENQGVIFENQSKIFNIAHDVEDKCNFISLAMSNGGFYATSSVKDKN
jgi:hypothetical protein